MNRTGSVFRPLRAGLALTILAGGTALGCKGRGGPRPELALSELFAAAQGGSCEATLKVVAGAARRQALARDQHACQALIAELRAHPVQQIGRVVPDGRSPGRMLVTARLAHSSVARTFTVVAEQEQWKVLSL